MTPFHRTVLSATALAGVLALGACKKDGVVAKDESVESVARKVAASDIKPAPGRWESNVKLEKMEMEGMPAQMKDAMAQRMAARTTSVCLTPEQAAKPSGGFFAGAEGCTYKHFAMTGGKIDAEMTCSQQGMTQTMTMAGTYGETQYDIALNTSTQGPGGKPMTMAMQVASHRTGDCNGKEDITAEDIKKMEDFAKSQEKAQERKK